KRLLAAEPDDPEAAYRLASAQLAGSLPAEALATLQELRQRLPEGSENVRLELLEARAHELRSDHRAHLAAADNAARVGDAPGARSLYDEALGIEREVANGLGEARVLNNLSNLQLHQGDVKGARESQEASLAIYRRVQNRSGIGGALNNLAEIVARTGEL